MSPTAPTPAALVLSPHLDDAAFSCGGLMALLADAGWHVCLATAFTRSMPNPAGFALACQTDKGLAPEIDYMAVRRAEDLVAADLLGVSDLRWLDLPEAPHRGYHAAPALFGQALPADAVWRDLAPMLAALVEELRPALVLAPQGLGEHVDHRQMIRAVLAAIPHAPLAFYRDTPYALRNPSALRNVTLPPLPETAAPIGAALDRKVAAACAYGTQLGFQFGGATGADEALRRFALAEGNGVPAERFWGPVPFMSGS